MQVLFWVAVIECISLLLCSLMLLSTTGMPWVRRAHFLDWGAVAFGFLMYGSFRPYDVIFRPFQVRRSLADTFNDLENRQ